MTDTETVMVPSDEGEYSPREAEALYEASINTDNRAGSQQVDAKALKTAQNICAEWKERLQPLHRRWRFIYSMLAGNSPERNGPEDVHVPEIYKAIETLIPRLEEAILERDPWFRVVARREVHRRQADTLAALYDWQFDQARIRTLIQPAIRDLLITQCAAFYGWWENTVKPRNIRTVVRKFDKKGVLQRKVKIKRKQVVEYAGPKVRLIDPLDFIIDTKSTDPQTAIYVGHRAWLTIEEIQQIGRARGWKNLDKITAQAVGTLGPENEYYSWPRDPTSRFRTTLDQQYRSNDGRPQKLEVVFIYTRWSEHDEKPGIDVEYRDTLMVVVGGKTVVEVRDNENDGEYRPYACMRSPSNGHEFYGTGVFDNAVRLNQHLDRYHQIFLRGASIAGQPLVFAEEDSDLPDSLYKVRPFSVFKGVGNVRFTTTPDGFLRAGPMVIGMLQKNIEETVGAFRINMGQDTGGTATEATLSLQEGNRRTRGLIRAVGNGLESVLEMFHRFTDQFSNEDVEFPVLGKRALDMRKDWAKIGPADLLQDVKFDLVGLHSLRTSGLRATGLQAFTTSMAPFIMANPTLIDQAAIVYDTARELIGPDEANRYVKLPTPIDDMRSQEEENIGLVTGTMIEVDPEDDDAAHIKALETLHRRAIDPDSGMPFSVRVAVEQHRRDHEMQWYKKQAQKSVQDNRTAQRQAMMPAEAGGDVSPETGRSSPRAGGMSDAMQMLGQDQDGRPGGQIQGENPGPSDSRKYPRSGRSKRTTNQTENSAPTV